MGGDSSAVKPRFPVAGAGQEELGLIAAGGALRPGHHLGQGLHLAGRERAGFLQGAALEKAAKELEANHE